jgi:hypothetical protein
VNTGQTKAQFDVYIDLKRSMQLVEEVGIDEALTLLVGTEIQIID